MTGLGVFDRDKTYTKKEAAGRVYEYLRGTGEKDIEDISPAAVLKDIYDCRTCVMSIAQVYLKGIIFPSGEREFGINEILHSDDIREIEERVIDQNKRIFPDFGDAVPDMENAFIEEEVIPAIDRPLIIDVREAWEYDNGHAEGAINIPLHRLYLNPHSVGDDIFRPVVFICDMGVKSRLAAEVVSRAGYRRVYYSRYARTAG